MNDKDTLIIISVFNEEQNLPAVLSDIKKYCGETQVAVIDDGSTDGSVEVARSQGARVISLPFNTGYGNALQTGYKYALRNGFEFVVQLDGDGQHNPADIMKLLGVVKSGEADVAVGSRFLESTSYKPGIVRRAGMLLFAKIVSFITNYPVTDPTSGFQALNRKAVEFYTSDLYPSDYPDADVLIMLHKVGLRMKEAPVAMRANPEGRAMHAGFGIMYYLFKMFLSIFVVLLRSRGALRKER